LRLILSERAIKLRQNSWNDAYILMFDSEIFIKTEA
jgi:hypothetical protein